MWTNLHELSQITKSSRTRTKTAISLFRKEIDSDKPVRIAENYSQYYRLVSGADQGSIENNLQLDIWKRKQTELVTSNLLDYNRTLKRLYSGY